MLLATSMITGVSLFIGDQRANSGVNVNTTIDSNYNQTNALLDKINTQTTTSRDTEITTTGTFALQTSAYSTLLEIWDSYGVATSMISEGVRQFGIPVWVQAFILGALSLMLMFAVLAAIFFGRAV